MTRYYAAVPRENLNGKKASLEDYYVLTEDTRYLWTALKEIDPGNIPAIVEFETDMGLDDLVSQMEETNDWEVDQIL